MKKYSFPAALAALVTLSACGTSEPANMDIDSDVVKESVSKTEKAIEPVEVAEGDTFDIGCGSGAACIGRFTIEKIVMSDKCIQKVVGPGTHNELEDGKTYLQILGVAEVNSGSEGMLSLAEPHILNAKKAPHSSTKCRESNGLASWATPLKAGMKTGRFGAWIVPEGTTYALWEGMKIKLPDTDKNPEVILPAVDEDIPVAPQPVTTGEAQSVEEPYVVECLFGTPGPSLMSDGTTRSTEFCRNQPGAQEYRDAENAAGYAPLEDYEEQGLPAYMTRTAEQERQRMEAHNWWAECERQNTDEYCRANDPYVN